MSCMRRKTQNELRCFCRTTPLLAMYGLDNQELYIHIRIYKQRRIFGEIVITGGKVKLRCRECLRWHTIIIRQNGLPALTETSVPDVIASDSIILAEREIVDGSQSVG